MKLNPKTSEVSMTDPLNELEAKAIKKKLFNILEQDDLNRDVPDKVRKVMEIVESTAKEATMRERERCAEIIDGETCSDISKCDCFSCDMLREMAAAIRQTEKEKE